MTLFVSHITVAQAATVINAFVALIQFTTSASLVILLIYFMPKTNTALTWSYISRSLHASIWPIFLRADSESITSPSAAVTTISLLTVVSTILLPISGVILPLGLRQGPLLSISPPENVVARYVPDTSPLALATTKIRQNFQYGRVCGVWTLEPCPGKDDAYSTSYPPSLIERFNSTPHGPFAMQYRRFWTSSKYQNLSSGLLATAQTLLLRDGAFMVEGLVVDMSANHPGIGFLNHTLPNLPDGGTWSEDVLWLEPVTSCVDTNMTLDYVLTNGPEKIDSSFNLTDHGGFYALPRSNPPLGSVGQEIDLHQRAYKAAAVSNRFAMFPFNATRESSFEGKQYTIPADGLNSTKGYAGLSASRLGKTMPLPLAYFNLSAAAVVVCRGYGGGDSANATNVHVSCSAYLGPPLRTDGGDIRSFDAGSYWSQHIYSCASSTRASIQTITFSTNSSTDLTKLSITRQPSKSPSLWAVEQANLTVAAGNLLWGRVADRYENDPSLWTIRSEGLYLPAGVSGLGQVDVGQPLAAHEAAWEAVYEPFPEVGPNTMTDFTGALNYAIKVKFQSLVNNNADLGFPRVQNLIWTDIMANNLVGTPTSSTLLVSRNQPSIEYNLKYAIPGFVLLLIWAPVFIISLFLLMSRKLSFVYMRQVLNNTSVGRIVTGTSMLRTTTRGSGDGHPMPEPLYMHLNDQSHAETEKDERSPGHQREKSDWADTAGNTPVTLGLDRKGSPHGHDRS